MFDGSSQSIKMYPMIKNAIFIFIFLEEEATKFFILSVIVTCHFFSSFPLFFRPLCRNPTKQEFLQLTPTFPLSERQIKKFRSCLL